MVICDNMHSYTVKPDNKKDILTVILILSGFFDLIMNYVVTCLSDLINDWMIAIIFLLTYFASYKLIYYLYNEKLWKSKIFGIFNKHPNISGKWKGTINNNEFAPITVNVEIIQTWSEIIMILTTDTAYSKTKCLFMDNEDKLRIDYIYLNETKGIDNQELRNHEGTCSLFISDDLKSMEGEYYTNHHRKSSGILKIKKIN
ncbi:hypothetical protein PXD04_11375 (plasmid) [Methanosphaera sp. ISO3-F5]|uniref:Cap15 family cyclic dinucleotide receptor domain-containing protein n=1 Tax=Methanosphaera sp. ISO3-F5 TaxID=1452353 RepID=UPI002B25BC0A|nr:hypothetical protein [Methanosphaera sp. ISO3-F5]WQH65342.1 hypothetical protein PXD04_11375 [Methanosphaera sp. ISO3-F5]